jgi:precorrin-3B synthase
VAGEGLAAGDACPGILDLHGARDGLVARIRLPGGYAGPARLRSLAALADRFGNGCVDLTARGNVQLRGVRAGAETADGLVRAATTAGLLPSPAHDRARNISASPLAGLAGRRGLRGAVRALDRAILADDTLAALPGRFLFSVDDGTGRAGLGRCDVGVLFGPGTAELIVAGRRTGRAGSAGQMITLAAAAARAFLGQRGNPPLTARVGKLPDGGAAVAAAVGGALDQPVPDAEPRLALGPLAHDAPTHDAPAHRAPDVPTHRAPGQDARAHSAPSHDVPADGTPAVIVAAALGRLTAAQLRLAASLVRPGEFARLASAGRIVLPIAGPAGLALARLAAAGLLTSDDDELAAVTACAGMACTRSLADVRSLAARLPGAGAVHWAGCDRRCGLPADATAVVATSADRFTVASGAGHRVLNLTAAGRPA